MSGARRSRMTGLSRRRNRHANFITPSACYFSGAVVSCTTGRAALRVRSRGERRPNPSRTEPRVPPPGTPCDDAVASCTGPLHAPLSPRHAHSSRFHQRRSSRPPRFRIAKLPRARGPTNPPAALRSESLRLPDAQSAIRSAWRAGFAPRAAAPRPGCQARAVQSPGRLRKGRSRPVAQVQPAHGPERGGGLPSP